jgi:hypothetical protein
MLAQPKIIDSAVLVRRPGVKRKSKERQDESKPKKVIRLKKL